jgi:hypothetical protein
MIARLSNYFLIKCATLTTFVLENQSLTKYMVLPPSPSPTAEICRNGYHEWQGFGQPKVGELGANENLNGLVRQYFPKEMDFGEITDERVTEVENILNNRPRKRYGVLTPYEVHAKATANGQRRKRCICDLNPPNVHGNGTWKRFFCSFGAKFTVSHLSISYSTTLTSVPMPSMLILTSSPLCRVKVSGGTMPVPVMSNTPCGKLHSRNR